MKVAIVGSRDYPDFEQVRRYVRTLPPGDVVVSGGARGVDSVATEEATACGLATLIFPADWKKFGKQAGFIRNADIVKTADLVVAFWDGESRGTKHSIDLANKTGKPFEIHIPELAKRAK